MFANIAGRVPVLFAGAVFDFKKKGIVQHLLHELKYNHRPEIGVFLGKIAGERLRGSSCFLPPDYIVPVPMHKRKEKKRGYNQSLCIAEGFAGFFPEAKIEKSLLEKQGGLASQTRKNRVSRWENVKTAFSLSSAARQEARFVGKHFLIIDDVFTTGATVESCARQILQIPDARVSVLTMAAPVSGVLLLSTFIIFVPCIKINKSHEIFIAGRRSDGCLYLKPYLYASSDFRLSGRRNRTDCGYPYAFRRYDR